MAQPSVDKIVMAHGGGGILTRRLIVEEIAARFDNPYLNPLNDSAIFPVNSGRLAFTTDSYVVKPIFFHGGDIGKLAVCGTVNDLAMAGAKPLYLSCAFLLHEGFPMDQLRKIIESIKKTAEEIDLPIATGDTKVVESHGDESIYINTTGIGSIEEGIEISSRNAKPGDCIMINGTIGDHGIAVLSERQGLKFQTKVESDVASLSGLVLGLFNITKEIHCLRDPTRGGLAAALNEIAVSSNAGIELYENRIPVLDAVKGACDMLGLDPLHIANEGKVIIICPEKYQKSIIQYLHTHPLGQQASVIGKMIHEPKQSVILKTLIGGERIVDIPYGEELPRIC